MEKEKDIIEIIVDEEDTSSDERAFAEEENIISDESSDGRGGEKLPVLSIKNRLFSFWDKLPCDLSPFFVKASAAVCALIVIAALIAGIFIPKSDSTVSNALAALREKDSEYITAKENNDSVSSEVESMNTRLAESQAELEEFTQSQDNLEKITDKIDEITAEKESLQSELSSKQNKLSSLTASLNAQSKKTITLTSGTYTVGKNIAAGTYTVTGSGSIAISNSGKSKVNKTLKSDGETFTLSDEDIIKIDGNAKFIPE
ncbi:MAG: hypothetical protein LIO53_01735 [Oscillospiraceae bacterium]|nr:hypothetical protein [Oscillospiraceae bacterium]